MYNNMGVGVFRVSNSSTGFCSVSVSASTSMPYSLSCVSHSRWEGRVEYGGGVTETGWSMRAE